MISWFGFIGLLGGAMNLSMNSTTSGRLMNASNVSVRVLEVKVEKESENDLTVERGSEREHT